MRDLWLHGSQVSSFPGCLLSSFSGFLGFVVFWLSWHSWLCFLAFLFFWFFGVSGFRGFLGFWLSGFLFSGFGCFLQNDMMLLKHGVSRMCSKLRADHVFSSFHMIY